MQVAVVAAEPGLSVVASADEVSVVPGQAINQHLVVSNTGNIALHGVTVTDTAAPDCADDGAFDLAVDGFTTIDCAYTTTGNDTGTYTNEASVTADEVTTPVVSNPVEVTVDDAVTVALSADQSSVVAGQAIGYHVTVKNTSPMTLVGLQVADEAAPDCAGGLGFGILPAGAQIVVDCTHVSAVADVGTFSNVATVDSGDIVAVESNQVDVIVAAQAPALSVSEAADPTEVVAGEPIDLALTVTNTGNVALHGITVADPSVPECQVKKFALAPGAQRTVYCSHVSTGCRRADLPEPGDGDRRRARHCSGVERRQRGGDDPGRRVARGRDGHRDRLGGPDRRGGGGVVLTGGLLAGGGQYRRPCRGTTAYWRLPGSTSSTCWIPRTTTRRRSPGPPPWSPPERTPAPTSTWSWPRPEGRSWATSTTTPPRSPWPGCWPSAWTSTTAGPAAGDVTAADGGYRISGLRPGPKLLELVDLAGGHDVEFYDDAPTPAGSSVLSVAGAAQTTADAGLAAHAAPVGGAHLTGQVSATTGEPLAGVAVMAVHSADFSLAAGGRTDAAGHYDLDLDAGDYKVAFYDPTGDHGFEWYDDQSPDGMARAASVTAGDAAPVDAALTPTTGVATGTVTEAGTATPLGNVGVFAIDATGTVVGVATTAGDGTYALTGLPVGNLRVRFVDLTGTYATEYYDDSPSYEGAALIAAAGATTLDVDAELSLAG